MDRLQGTGDGRGHQRAHILSPLTQGTKKLCLLLGELFKSAVIDHRQEDCQGPNVGDTIKNHELVNEGLSLVLDPE